MPSFAEALPGNLAASGLASVNAAPGWLSSEHAEWGFSVALVVGLLALSNFTYRNESGAVCNQIAYSTYYDQIYDPGCTHDPKFNGHLVYFSCPLYYRGATDLGTGLHTIGYSVRLYSMLLQYRLRMHYPRQYSKGSFGGDQHGSDTGLREQPCLCFEKVWSVEYIELDPSYEYHPRLCGAVNIYVGSVCEPWYRAPCSLRLCPVP